MTSRVHLRGFGSMDPDRQREIARLGGSAIPPGKRSYSQDQDLARRAGAAGGKARKLAYENGQAAFRAGRPLEESNPYPKARASHGHFVRGWRDAEAAGQ